MEERREKNEKEEQRTMIRSKKKKRERKEEKKGKGIKMQKWMVTVTCSVFLCNVGAHVLLPDGQVSLLPLQLRKAAALLHDP